jgi:hypothetical protein
VSGQYRATYTWRQAVFLGPTCGLCIGVMLALTDHGTLGSALTGVATMFGLIAMWGYRIRVQRRESFSR